METNIYYITKGRKIVLTELGEKELIQQYGLGYSQNKIADKFGVSRDVVIRWMKELKIPTRTRKYTINENYFENIDNEEKAYWLGFMSADGYVHNERGELTLELQERDKHHVEKFRTALGSQKPLLTILCGPNKEFTHYRFVTRCRKMVDDLKKYNVVQRKSLTFTPPANILKELIPYWIIGYMDGDGCICKYNNKVKIYFTGTYATLSFIKQYFNSLNKISLEHRCLNTYRYQLEADKSTTFLKEINYKNLPFALERKKERFASIIQ